MKQKAEYFFKRTTTTNLPTEREEAAIRDQKARRDEVVHWERCMNAEGSLVEAKVLFEKFGATSPIVDASTFEELVMCQYKIAKAKGQESWLFDARRSSIRFFFQQPGSIDICSDGPAARL